MTEIVFEDAGQFDEWLAGHHEQQEPIWLKIAKKGSGKRTISGDEAVDVGLCWGWISSHRKALDDDYFLQKYSRRRPRSKWSLVNVDKVAVLEVAGRMRPPGMAEVLAAKADGRWEKADTAYGRRE
jgi:uncharacterized protein YdeI (YjbR/CyaY-like superfamily)